MQLSFFLKQFSLHKDYTDIQTVLCIPFRVSHSVGHGGGHPPPRRPMIFYPPILCLTPVDPLRFLLFVCMRAVSTIEISH